MIGTMDLPTNLFSSWKSKMKLFLDDVRKVEWSYPDDDPMSWKVVRTPQDFLNHIKSGKVTTVSFDNDLGMYGEHEGTMMEGRDLLGEMIIMILDGDIPMIHDVRIHSANVPAANAMKAEWESFYKNWEEYITDWQRHLNKEVL